MTYIRAVLFTNGNKRRFNMRLQTGFVAALAPLALVFALNGCASRTDMDQAKREIGIAKGEIENLNKAIASQAQELKVAQGTVEQLKAEVKELRDAAKAAPEKVQNKTTGARPKSKKKHR